MTQTTCETAWLFCRMLLIKYSTSAKLFLNYVGVGFQSDEQLPSSHGTQLMRDWYPCLCQFILRLLTARLSQVLWCCGLPSDDPCVRLPLRYPNKKIQTHFRNMEYSRSLKSITHPIITSVVFNLIWQAFVAGQVITYHNYHQPIGPIAGHMPLQQYAIYLSSRLLSSRYQLHCEGHRSIYPEGFLPYICRSAVSTQDHVYNPNSYSIYCTEICLSVNPHFFKAFQ